MTSFSAGGTTVTFEAVETLSDKGGQNGLEEITVGILVPDAATWGALFSLRSWNVAVRPVPGGNNVYVDIGGGAGVGSLIIDNLDNHNAILTSLTRSDIEPGTLRSRGQATFLVTS